CQQGYTLPWTF
nr:immunoglobulin light chain junction region [Mus musculus]NSL97088.1 immunoglobulin light chain junction region [Mus musculus]NSL97187.1 immunoglobulin light chain junction region [Mus musculus]NSL97986.1 immunoglobulin light chain junction region [Mus musculus]NSL98560.1 immunoglobulin light chain junction region [Mus musculus]